MHHAVGQSVGQSDGRSAAASTAIGTQTLREDWRGEGERVWGCF